MRLNWRIEPRHAARVSQNRESGSHTFDGHDEQSGVVVERMLDTFELGKRAAVQVTEASSIGERIRKWETRHVRSSWTFQRTRASRAVPG